MKILLFHHKRSISQVKFKENWKKRNIFDNHQINNKFRSFQDPNQKKISLQNLSNNFYLIPTSNNQISNVSKGPKYLLFQIPKLINISMSYPRFKSMKNIRITAIKLQTLNTSTILNRRIMWLMRGKRILEKTIPLKRYKNIMKINC